MSDADLFGAKLNRLKTALGVSKDKEAGDLLGLKDKAFNARKSRGSFPEKELRALAQQRPDLGIDVEHVLSGVSSAVTTAATVLRESTDQVMRLGLPSTESIAVRDIVYGARTGNRQLVEDGIALLSAGMPVATKGKATPGNKVQVSSTHGHAAGRDVHVNQGGPVDGGQKNSKPGRTCSGA